MSCARHIATTIPLLLTASLAGAQQPTRTPARNKPLIAMIDRYLRDPFNADLGGAIMDSGDARHDVTMVLAAEVMPWTCYADTNTTLKALDQLLSIVYVAGNMRAQLAVDSNANNVKEGMAAVIRVYPLVKAQYPRYVVPEVERWLSMPATARRAFADSVARHLTECSSRPALYRPGVFP